MWGDEQGRKTESQNRGYGCSRLSDKCGDQRSKTHTYKLNTKLNIKFSEFHFFLFGLFHSSNIAAAIRRCRSSVTNSGTNLCLQIFETFFSWYELLFSRGRTGTAVLLFMAS